MTTASSRRWPRLPTALSIACLAIASSAIGIANRYTYDDRYIIELNPFARTMHQWWRVFATSYWPRDWGGDGYRPLTVLAFKIESTLGRGSPVPFHAVNILLYALTAMLVFAVAKRLLPLWAAWTSAALFAVHPVHVEAVANIVGQSELLVGLALLGSTILYIDARSRGELTLRSGLAIAALYVVGCFSKEHGIVLPAILAVAELTVIDDPRRLGEKIRRLRPFYLILAALAVAFVGVRSLVLSDHPIGGFAPFTPFSSLHITWLNRALTALGVVPQWLRLFFWPARLSAEYGPPDIEIAQGVSISQLPGFLILFATLTFGVLLRRRRPVISFGIAFVCITLLPSSNFILPAGIVLAERTLFLPSVGAMLVAGGAAAAIGEWMRAHYSGVEVGRVRVLAQASVVLLLVAGVVRSGSRTLVWKDNETLFNHSVLDSPNAYRAHYMLGAWSFEKNRMRIGEAEYKEALALFPYDPSVSYNLAERYRSAGLCRPAVPLYRWTRGLDPNYPFGRTALAACLLADSDYVAAKAAALDAIGSGGPLKTLRGMIATADSAIAAQKSQPAVPVTLAGAPGKVR
jgi:protein O-mannosyl-transferase